MIDIVILFLFLFDKIYDSWFVNVSVNTNIIEIIKNKMSKNV